jgi:hypothetical protein
MPCAHWVLIPSRPNTFDRVFPRFQTDRRRIGAAPTDVQRLKLESTSCLLLARNRLAISHASSRAPCVARHSSGRRYWDRTSDICRMKASGGSFARLAVRRDPRRLAGQSALSHFTVLQCFAWILIVVWTRCGREPEAAEPSTVHGPRRIDTVNDSSRSAHGRRHRQISAGRCTHS